MPMPALFTRMLIVPCRATTWSISAFTCAASATSHARPLADPSRCAFSSATAASSLASSRPETTTVAPHSTSPCAIPSPIPLFPPVTTATLPVRSNRLTVSSFCDRSADVARRCVWHSRRRPLGRRKLAARFERLGQQLDPSDHRWEASVGRAMNQQLDQLVTGHADVERAADMSGRLPLPTERQQNTDRDQLARPHVQPRTRIDLTPGVLDQVPLKVRVNRPHPRPTRRSARPHHARARLVPPPVHLRPLRRRGLLITHGIWSPLPPGRVARVTIPTGRAG